MKQDQAVWQWFVKPIIVISFINILYHTCGLRTISDTEPLLNYPFNFKTNN